MKTKFRALIVLEILLTTFLAAQTPSLAPEVLTGVLPDGITYFIQNNAKPVHRVELSLIVHAGSVLETEDQRGLAHLLEHMEFQGTEHFAPQAIVSFLETNGMKFGADLNANTGFTSTRYYLALPTDKPEIFDTGLQILEDWARGPRITASEFENEKKVVLEEGRLRMNNVRGRISDFEVPALYEESPYAHRLPIGSMDVVRNATADQLMAFVQAWYRPENMAIVIAGDIDAAAVKQTLLSKFTAPIRESSKKVVDAPLAPLPGRTAKVYLDKEMAFPEVLWLTTETPPKQSPEAFWHFQLLNQLLSRILSTNLSGLTRSATPPFQDAGVYGRTAFGGTWERTFVVEPYEGRTVEGVEAFTTELERARSHGFTATDFQLAVSELKSQIESTYAQRDAITNEDRVGNLADYFLNGMPAEGDEAAHRLALGELSAITLAELNRFANQALAFPDFRMVLLAPEKPGLTPPSEAEVLAAIARVQNSTVAAAVERQVVPLMEKAPMPGKILTEQKLANLGVTVYTLANGARVMAKKTDFTPHQVLIHGQRLGGLSLIDDKDFLSVSQGATVFSQTGLGRLNQTQMGDFLSGKQVQIEAAVGPTAIDLQGSTTTTDLETLFQMVHEQLGPPHRDANAEQAWYHQTRDLLANSQNLPETLAGNEINHLMMNGHPRSLPLTTERLALVDLDRAAKLYGELWGNPRGLVLSVVGDFDEAALKSLIETYVASVAPGPETPVKDRGIRPTPGPVKKVLTLGTNDKAENTFVMSNPRPFRPDDRFAANVLRQILDIRLRDVLRNQNGGTYDVGSALVLSPFPYPQVLVEVQFTCDPVRKDELAAKALEVLSSVAAGQFDEATFAKAQAIQVREVEGYLSQNEFWTGILPEYTLKGYDLSELARIKELYQGVTRTQVETLAKQVLTTQSVLQITLSPAPVSAILKG